ncbi:MAG: lipopolysaccharide heptosyltransferase II [Candidatus Cloacimonetes bacterium HGW-Cloacimonetes-1]|jgi:lipopolysaccharide heptosyltransferase II|nr:MAG: lipopolysaccharide heptosyltransferase II [Candidatus Cloacimonetes bacterium HGW-Cloacimonetes-1]
MQKIKVLHIDTEMGWRGGQQQAVYLYEAMLSAGDHCTFVCRPGSKLSQYFRQKSLPYKEIDFRGEWDAFAGFRLSLFARRHHYKILHLHSGHALSWGLWAKLFQRSLILIAARRVDFGIRKNWFSRWKYRTTLLNQIVAISDNIKNVLLQDGIPESKIVTIHSGVDLDRHRSSSHAAEVRSQWNIPVTATVVGTIAAFVGHKDYPTLINAAALAISDNPLLYFMAIGDGEQRPQIEALIDKLGIRDRFILCGFQTDVGSFLDAFDIYVMASKLEGLGTSVIDALAVGLPVIGTRAGGIPEMIEHEYNGLLVESQNPPQLAAAIVRLATDEDLYKTLLANTKSSAEKFSIRHTVRKNRELYHSIWLRSIRKILFIQTAFIGDVILSTPLPKALKLIFPEAEIDVVLIPQTEIIYRNNPNIRNIYTYNKRQKSHRWLSFWKLIRTLRRNHYDLAVSVHVSYTTSFMMLLSGSKERLGYPRQKFTTISVPFEKGYPIVMRSLKLVTAFTNDTFDHQTELFIDPAEFEQVEEFIQAHQLTDQPLIAVAPSSVWETKKWPWEHFAELISLIDQAGYRCILIGSREDYALCEQIIKRSNTSALNCAGMFSLMGSAALIQKCKVLLSNDSSPLHLANAVRTPVLAFFGPTVKRFGFYPYQTADKVLEIELPCRPCGKHGSNRCPLGHFRCMKDISPVMAFEALKRVLNGV